MKNFSKTFPGAKHKTQEKERLSDEIEMVCRRINEPFHNFHISFSIALIYSE